MEEPQPVVAAPSHNGLAAFALRFAWVYLIALALPFPLSTALSIIAAGLTPILSILGVPTAILAHLESSLFMLVDSLWSLFTVPLGQMLGTEVSLHSTGSGDRAHDYLRMGMSILLSLVIALIWHLRRGPAIADRSARWLHVWARWWLALRILPYAFIKMQGQQFMALTPSELLLPLSEVTPMHLAWSFYGLSPAYQCLLGLAELVPAILILHRRTALPGLLIMGGVLSNVFALNLFFDIPVKLSSGHNLLATLLLLIPYRNRLLALFQSEIQIPNPQLRVVPRKWSQPRWNKLTFIVGTLSVLGCAVSTYAQTSFTQSMLKPSSYEGLWSIQSLTRDGAAWSPKDTERWRSLSIDNLARLKLHSPSGEDTVFRFQESQDGSALELTYPFLKSKDIVPTTDSWTIQPGQGKVEVRDPNPKGPFSPKTPVEVRAPTIQLQGHWKGHHYTLTAIKAPLPIHQGFRWVQETPYR